MKSGLKTHGLVAAVNSGPISPTIGFKTALTAPIGAIKTTGALNKILSDGKDWFFSGDIESINPLRAPGLAMLQPTDGSQLPSCNLGSGFPAGRGAWASYYDSATNLLYLGGNFANYQGPAVQSLIRINADTCALDTSFLQGSLLYGNVYALARSGTSLYVGGSFSLSVGSKIYHDLVKLDVTTGAVDATFSTNTFGGSSGIKALAVYSGFVYAGGYFTSYKGTNAQSLIKVDQNTGALDPTFNQAQGIQNNSTAQQGWVYAISATPLGLFVGGYFQMYRGTQAFSLVKLSPTDGSLDATFTLKLNKYSAVYALLADGTGSYLLIGSSASTVINGANQYAPILRVDATGKPEPTFTSGLSSGSFDSYVTALVQAGNSIYVGGLFKSFQSHPAVRIAKLGLNTGLLDQSFTQNTGLDHYPSAIAATSKAIVASGLLQFYRGQPGAGIIRVHGDGSYDIPFSNAPNGAATVHLITDDSIYATFDNGSTLARIDRSSGEIDPNFNYLCDAPAEMTLLNGSLYVTGYEISCNGQSYGALAKVDAKTGAVDPAWPKRMNGTKVENAFWVTTDGESIFIAEGYGAYYQQLPYTVLSLDPVTGSPKSSFSGTYLAQNDLGNLNGFYAEGDWMYFMTSGASKGTTIAKLNRKTGLPDPSFVIDSSVQIDYDAAMTGYGGKLYLLSNGYLSTLDQNTAALETLSSQLFANVSSGERRIASNGELILTTDLGSSDGIFYGWPYVSYGTASIFDLASLQLLGN